MNKKQHVKPNLYTYMMEALKEIARKHGYNLLVHGSLNRDLDLIAVPWTNNPKPEIDLIKALDFYLTGKTRTSATGNDSKAYMFEKLPGGRSNYVIEMARHGEWNNYEKDMQYYLDISVTPLIKTNKPINNIFPKEKHICGLQGFNPVKGDNCPACDNKHNQNI